MPKKNIALAIGVFAIALLTFSPQSALAVAENDPCTAAQEGEWRQLDSPNGDTHLYCNGANWVAFRNFQNGDIVFEPGSEPVLTIKDEGMIQLQAVTGLSAPSYAGLDDLGDVDAAAPNADDVLAWDDSNWVPVGAGAGGAGGKWLDGTGEPDEIYYSAGNVGIGVTDPDAALEIAGDIHMSGADPTLLLDGGASLKLQAGPSSGSHDALLRFKNGAGGNQGLWRSNNAWEFSTTSVLSHDGPGDLIFRTNSGTIESKARNASDVALTARGAASQTADLFQVKDSTDTVLFNVTAGGKVGIGAPTPGYTLEVNGDAAKPGGGSWFNASDARLKDVHGTYDKGLDDLLKLKPVRFSYAQGNARGLPSDTEYVGFIAQEVQSFFPEAISRRKDGYLDFDMHPVNVALVNAVHALKAEDDDFRARLDALEARLPKEPEPAGYNE